MNRIVIQTAFLGDVVLTTPLLAALAADGDGPVDIVTTPQAAPLVETHPAVRVVIVYDKRGRERGVRALGRLAGRLARARYDVAYLPHRSLRSALVARLAGIPRRIGFAGPWSFLYTEAQSRPSGGRESDRLLALIGASPGAFRARLYPTAEDEARVRGFLAGADVPDDFVALAPGSIWGSKRWPYYPELAARLAERIAVVAVGAAEDTALCEAIVQAAVRAGGRAASAAGALTVRQSAALIGQARLLVTNDSAPVHFAGAMGTPVIALFGPTVPEFGFAPSGPADLVLGVSGLACRPCSDHGPPACPLGHHRCMKDLRVETVVTGSERTYAAHRRD